LKVRYHRTGEHDDLPVKVPALKELLCRGGFRHRWPLAPQGQLFKFAPEPLTYGNASRPGSPHMTDQISLFQEKQLRPVYRTREEVEAHTVKEEQY
jgi:hypothetical protein